jgi:hypothetical protein
MIIAYSKDKVDAIPLNGGDKVMEHLLFMLIIIGCHVSMRLLVVIVIAKSL